MVLPYRSLDVWQRSEALALRVNDLSRRGAWDFYLRDQVCRAAFSVPANIAEGNGRSMPRDYASYVDRARGSLFELDSWLHSCHEMNLMSEPTHRELTTEIEALSAMLLSLARTLRRKAALPSRQ
jgi:four helix bundle protein